MLAGSVVTVVTEIGCHGPGDAVVICISLLLAVALALALALVFALALALGFAIQPIQSH